MTPRFSTTWGRPTSRRGGGGRRGRGRSRLAAGGAGEAVDGFRAAVRRKPDFVAALYHQALAHRALDEPKEVRRSLIRALEIEPQLARAWHALATLDAEAGNLDIAAAL